MFCVTSQKEKSKNKKLYNDKWPLFIRTGCC